MRRRRHYGTTGNRLLLDVSAHVSRDAHVFLKDPAYGKSESYGARILRMGDIAQVPGGAAVELHVDVIGSAPIERIDVFRGRECLATHRPYTREQLGARVRLTYEGAEYRGRARTTTWDGKLWLAGNRIEATSVFNNWNLDRGIKEQDAASIVWKAVTTGNYGGIDIWLAQAAAGELHFKTGLVEGVVALGDITDQPTVFDAGGLGRALSLQRLPGTMTERRATIRLPVDMCEHGDTALYVRVQQEDGHRAWTSPIYLFR